MNDFQQIGKYEVVGKIGQGAFGIVFEGRDPNLKRRVAIKVCAAEDEALRRRFEREAEIAGRLEHEHIVVAYDYGVEQDYPYLVQEFLDGEDLDKVIGRQPVMPTADKIQVLRQIATALDYAHGRGVIHRDIKPGNIRLLPNGDVKILDFGIAKLLSAETQLTQKGVAMGTASYLPPEQVRAEELDHRADIFSFGVLAYELLAYDRPFKGNTLSALVYQILYKIPPGLGDVWSACPPKLATLVARCLEKKPADRFETFADVLTDLDAIDVDEPSVDPAAETLTMPRTAEESGNLATTQRITMPASGAATESQGEDDGFEAEVDAAFANASLRETEVLNSRAQEIGSLIAQGQLDEARRELEDTISRLPTSPEGLGEVTAVLVPPDAAGSDTGPVPPSPSNPPSPTPAIGAETGPITSPADTGPIVPPPMTPPAVAPPAPAADSTPPPLDVGSGPVPPPPDATGPLPSRSEPAQPSPSQAPPPSIATPAAKPKSPTPGGGNKKLMLILAAVVAVGLITVVGLFFMFAGGKSEPEPEPEVVTPVLPPPPAPVETEVELGALAVSVAPWGEITEIADQRGYLQDLPEDATTPLVLRLEPGAYTISILPAGTDEVWTCEADVTLEATARCEYVPETASDITAYFKDTGWWP
ncbi:MAG: serine/threonine-protein kinase [Acidobacteriota bacterium]